MPSAAVAVISLVVAAQAGSSPPVGALPARPVFEVASVKPNRSGATAPQRISAPPGEQVTMINVPLRTLIQFAYRLPADSVIGGPGWIGSDRFDVVAKASAPASVEELRSMLRALLEDRFTLVSHMETRQVTSYALMAARTDGRLGPGLRTAAVDCTTPAAREAHGGPGPTHPCNPVVGIGQIGARGLPLDRLAGMLSTAAGGPVVDASGLSGNFDWDVSFTPQAFLQGSFDRERFPFIDPDGPSIFTAVQEQLGLKLEPRRTDIDVLVIDAVEQPTPD
jgi:uncharacterized protein (TIGR03435 family)